jgi:SAM-dependent methyltransferase
MAEATVAPRRYRRDSAVTSTPMGPLAMLPTMAAEDEVLSEAVRRHASGRAPLQILEAGCGQRWSLDLEEVDYVLTGVDVDAEALRLRMTREGDLHECLRADIRSAPLAAERFDVVYSSFVLEHVEGAEAALDNLVRALRPGGLLLLRVPDRDTVYGLITRKTPFWFHVLYSRVFYRNPDAGKPGHAPFRTRYDEVVSRRGLHAYCAARGLRVTEEYGSNYHLGVFGPLAGAVRLALKGVEVASRGRLRSDHANITFVIEKPAAQVRS